MYRLLLLFLITLSLWGNSEDINNKVKQQYQKIFDTAERNNSVANTLYGNFSLKAHHTNYYLPLSLSLEQYYSYEESEEYRQIESQVQISVRFDLFYNLFGMNEIFSLAYTQQAFWQNYTPSSPFRETLYNPEAFFLFPLEGEKLRALQTGYAHQSNGQGLSYNDDGSISEQNNRSRTWNYLYATVHALHSNIGLELTAWARILKTEEDSTPDLYDYIGYGNLKLRYTPDNHWLEIMVRGNLATGYGAIEASYSYPLWFRDDLFWYAKVFEGYGESLIDYNNHITTFSLGVSFSR